MPRPRQNPDLRTLDVFSISEAARACRVSRVTIWRHIRAGRLGSHRGPEPRAADRHSKGWNRDRSYRISRVDLVAFMLSYGLPTDLVTGLGPSRST